MSIAKLGGYALLGSSEVSWSLRPGTSPVIKTFDMIPDEARSLFNQTAQAKKPTTLELKNNVRGTTETYSNLWVLRLAPGENRNIMRVVVADRRWMWDRAVISRSYNIRRHVGVKIAIASDQIATNPIVPKYAYAKWSLKNEGDPPASKWTPEDLIKDVMDEIAKFEKDFSGTSLSYSITSAVGSQIKGLPVEDLELHDNGDQAVARMLSYFPEAEICLDKDGAAIIYSRVDGGEKDIVSMLGPELVGRGHFEFIENCGIRPSQIEVYFPIESELRMDFHENASARSSTGTQVEGQESDDLRIDNVGPVPDYQLSNTYAQGTWLTMDQLFNAWGPFPDPFGGGGQQLDHKMVQKAFMPFQDLWAKMGLIGSFDPDRDWGPRLAVVHGHYRQTFRFNSRIMDKIRSWRDYRVATVDITSGQRAPAMCWGDYAVLNNTRSCYKTREAASHAYILNKAGYPTSGKIDSTASPSPARVKMLDHDQGIVHVEYFDPWGVYQTFFPSLVDSATMPNGDLGKKGTRWILFDSIGDPGQELPHLSPSMNMALIITAMPASPNNLYRYFKITVKPDDVKDIVPGGASVLGAAYGPPIKVLCHKETARVQWLDDRASDIKMMFGLNTVAAGPPNLNGLVINEGDKATSNSSGGAASLWDIAKAEAARTWALFGDRFLGSAHGDFKPGVVPKGFVDEIAHSVTTQGEMVTKVALREKPDPFPLESLLSSTTRAILMRQIQL